LIVRAGGAAALVLAMGSAHAYVYCDKPDEWPHLYQRQEANRKNLVERRFEALDGYFNKLFDDFEAGKRTDAEIDLEFRAFANAKPEYEPLMAEWKKLGPRSRAAQFASAFYWIQRGWAARGDQIAHKTSDEQFAAMTRAFERATRDLEAARQLAKTPTPELAQRIRILQSSSERGKETPTTIYEKAIKEFPRTLSVRTHYANASTPHWGGSFGRLDEIRKHAESLPPDDRRYVQSRVDDTIGDSYSFRKDYKEAARAYERAAPACPALVDANKSLLWIHANEKNYAAQIPVATRYLEAYPNTTQVMLQRGYAYVTVGKYEEAFKDFNRAAQLGNGIAYEHLAWMHERGYGLPKYDYAKAIEYYMLADAKGVRGAREKADKIRAATGLK
jgi:tetratricopeptide (TPR) repeat protein